MTITKLIAEMFRGGVTKDMKAADGFTPSMRLIGFYDISTGALVGSYASLNPDGVLKSCSEIYISKGKIWYDHTRFFPLYFKKSLYDNESFIDFNGADKGYRYRFKLEILAELKDITSDNVELTQRPNVGYACELTTILTKIVTDEKDKYGPMLDNGNYGLVLSDILNENKRFAEWVDKSQRNKPIINIVSVKCNNPERFNMDRGELK